MTEEKKDNLSLKKAYVKESELVLDPSKLDKSALERMPSPVGWRLLILPYKGKGVTDGGIVLTKQTVDREAVASTVGYVLKVGDLAYTDEGKFEGKPWCKEGDWIIFGRYAGCRLSLEDDHEVRIINDDEVIATIHHPDDIRT